MSRAGSARSRSFLEGDIVQRALVTGAFLLLAAVILAVAFLVGTESGAGTLFINLGTEVVGIVLTVAIVEWFFERRRLQSQGRQLAWDSLHAVGQAVWVWQGGPREMDTDEMLGILDAVGEDDPLPEFTEGLLLTIGTQSRRLLSDDQSPVKAMPGLMNGLEELARLSSIRDGTEPMAPRRVAEILEQGTRALAKALGKPTERHLASLIRHRDPSVNMQERRHFGVGGMG